MGATKKVLLINTHYSGGGAAQACRRLLESLQFSKFSVSILVQKLAKHAPNAFGLNEKAFFGKKPFLLFLLERLFFITQERSKTIRFAFSPANVGTDISYSNEVQTADIVHFHWINHGFLSMQSIADIIRLKKPIVWTLHDMWLFTGGCHHNRGCFNYMNACGNCLYLKKPSKNDISHQLWVKKKQVLDYQNITIITPSNWLANQAAKSSLIKGKKIFVIPNPINTELFKPSSNKIESKLKLGFETDKFHINFIAANLSNLYKGGDYLKQAFEILAQTEPELFDKIELVVIGNTKDRLLETFPKSVNKVGFIYNEALMIDYYNASDVFVLPSLEENLPNTIMESMACGVPAIAFNVGGIEDLIDHKINGYLATYKDSTDLANGLKFLLLDKKSRLEYGINCRKKVEDKYSYSIVAAKHEALYESLL